MYKNKNQIDYYIYNTKHIKFLTELPKLTQKVKYFKILTSPKEFYNTLLYSIYQAYNHIYLVTLYLENDTGGRNIINAILNVKKNRPNIKIKIIVDWYRAQRGRLGESKSYTNICWYNDIMHKYSDLEILIYSVPISITEILGVLHLKGFIIDDKILYSGASISNEYLHIYKRYRYDRYHIIHNQQLSDVMLQYIEKELLSYQVINKFRKKNFFENPIITKNSIRLFRKKLKKVCYNYQNNANFNELSVTPLVGIGKNSILNKTIYHLISAAQKKITLCTPYFNIPDTLIKKIIFLLRNGKNIEIIVGDKISNDFYKSYKTSKSFKLINIIPYLYEINLRSFLKKFQNYLYNKQLIVRLWSKENNGYHIKGIWVDDEWQLITGSNLNPRSLKFDLENALLIHDPLYELVHQKNKELNNIRMYTKCVINYTSIESIYDYPIKIRQYLLRIKHIRLNLLINRLL